MAVGFADGGHQSLGRPSDIYRQDLDDVAEGWSGYSRAPIVACAGTTPPAASANPPGSTGWLVLPLPGSPLSVVLYIDDLLACQLACDEASQDQEAAGLALPASTFDRQACTLDDLDAAFVQVAELAGLGMPFVGCDDFACGPTAEDTSSSFGSAPASEESAPDAVATGMDDAPAGDDLALDVAAACAGLPGPAAWQLAVDRATRCEFAWEGCDGYPNGAVDGWLARRDLVPSAEAWREIGRLASQVLNRLGHERDNLLTATTRQLANWLNISFASQCTHRASPPSNPPPPGRVLAGRRACSWPCDPKPTKAGRPRPPERRDSGVFLLA